MTGLLALATLAKPALLPPTAPKLVVLISIDQCRADYIDRFSDHYLPAKKGGVLGGFRWLSETGVRFTDAHHHHLPTATGPGHSILMTGSVPSVNGIVGNSWWDREAGKEHYVTADETVQTVGGKSAPQSPFPLKVTTVGDELKMATNGKSKIVGVAFKDRASILMAGHAADDVVWFDASTGNWVTSTFYSKTLPAWAEKINQERLSEKSVGKSWTPAMPKDAYGLARRAPHEKATTDGSVFNHPLGEKANSSYFSAFTKSAQGQTFVFDTVERALDAEQLGQHDVPDILVMNLSTNDYVGHSWGPNSPEVLDISVVTDRLLSRLFNKLNRTVGMDKVAVVVSSDHGVCPIPGEQADVYRIGAKRISGDDVVKAVDTALDKKFGAADWVLGELFEQNLYLNRKEIAAKGLKSDEVERVAAEAAMTAPGIYAALGRNQILNNQVPRYPWADWVYNGFHPTLGGDVFVIEGPNQVYTGATGTSHGSIWAYDTHIPILTHFPGQKAQKVARRVYTHDIASTLCTMLGIEYPSGNVGQPLIEALPVKR